MFFWGKERIGIDLGTSNTRIYIDNKGIALKEPSILALNKETNEVVAVGKEAEQLVGRTSDKYDIVRPIRESVAINFKLTKHLLAYFIKKALRRSASKAEVVIAVPSSLSQIERRALHDILKELGIHRAMMVPTPFVAALGANLAIDVPYGRLIVDIGGGSTDIATISFGEIVERMTLQVSGDLMNQAIIDHVREQYHLAIGYKAAETLKMSLGNAKYTPHDAVDTLLVQGRNTKTGVPDEKLIHAKVIAEALDNSIIQIAVAIKQLLNRTQPEIATDIMDSGIILTGGIALLKRLPERLYDEIGIPVHIANNPMDAVAIGTGKLFNEMSAKSRIVEKNAR